MTEMRSSSNRSATVCDAVLLQQDDRPLGPIRLPDHRVDDFVDHFNRTYEGLGIRLAPIPVEEVPEDANEKIPGSVEAAGDSSSHEFVCDGDSERKEEDNNGRRNDVR